MNAEQSNATRWFSEEVQPHEAALRAYLRARFPNLTDIDDVVQETYIRLLRANQSGQVAHVRSYLFATARNAALDLFRRAKIISFERIADLRPLLVVEDRPDAAEVAGREDELQMLTEAIHALPARCREVLVQRKIHGLSHQQIADRLGISCHTVNAQITLGVMRCREFLRARGALKGASDEQSQPAAPRRL